MKINIPKPQRNSGAITHTVLTFGKYKGQRIDEVPRSYLEWVCENATNIDPNLLQSIENFLRR